MSDDPRHDDDGGQYDLIDKHLAGTLTPNEVAELEHLIRTRPDWAERYREAEEMVRLLRRGLGAGRGAPDAVKRQIRREVFFDRGRSPRTGWFRPWMAAAAAMLVLLGAYLVGSSRDDDAALLPVAYAAEPLPFKDLVRSADVGLIARTEMRDGRVRLRPVEPLFGTIDGRAFQLPAGLAAGHEIAIFGRNVGDSVITVVGGDAGIVHLDGVQRWEGRDVAPATTRRLLRTASRERGLPRAVADLERFLDAPGSRRFAGRDVGETFTASVTARFLGDFALDDVREPLMRLVMNGDKHPEARHASAEALVHSDPRRACRSLLSNALAASPPILRAETEDGQVLLSCLHLMRREGEATLRDDLEALASRLLCPALRAAASEAAKAVAGDVPRDGPAVQGGRPPVRVSLAAGQEGLVLAGCEGRDEGVIVVFPGARGIAAFRPLVGVAVGDGVGVVFVAPGTRDVTPFVDAGRDRGMLADEPPRFVVDASDLPDALAAAAHARPEVIVVLGGIDEATKREAADRGLTLVAGADQPATLLDDEDVRADLLGD